MTIHVAKRVQTLQYLEVKACPPDILAELKSALSHYGPDESKWPRMFCMASYFPWVTPEEIAESKRKEQEQIWAGVRLLKEHFDGRAGEALD